jgi:DNA-binding GntR family transcriptional regulator
MEAGMTFDTPASVRPILISDELRARLLDGSEAPGSTITESAVALQFSVTRPTARLAIERLVTEGLLRRETHQAARVPELSRDDIRDVFDNRAIVEAAATVALARSGAVPPAAIAAQRDLLAHRDDFARHDIAFHRALVAGQHSPRLARMHALLMGEVELCIGQVQAHQLIEAATVAAQHQGILDAITAGDPELADRLTRDHIDGARDALLEHFDATHERA